MAMKSTMTDEGAKTLLTTNQEQRDYAKVVDSSSFYCLSPHKDGWVVEMVTDVVSEADTWFENQKRARVYRGQTGHLRHAK